MIEVAFAPIAPFPLLEARYQSAGGAASHLPTNTRLQDRQESDKREPAPAAVKEEIHPQLRIGGKVALKLRDKLNLLWTNSQVECRQDNTLERR